MAHKETVDGGGGDKDLLQGHRIAIVLDISSPRSIGKFLRKRRYAPFFFGQPSCCFSTAFVCTRDCYVLSAERVLC
jgi:hypothetical protein